MYINTAIRNLMKAKSISLSTMANSIGKGRGNDISSRLRSSNLSFNSAVEMLNVLGYEIVIQERKPGQRRADQILIDQKPDNGSSVENDKQVATKQSMLDLLGAVEVSTIKSASGKIKLV